MKQKKTYCEPGIRKFSYWWQGTGNSSVTGWRYRKFGWIKTVNIAGVPYVTDEEIKRFLRRAEAGEFSKKLT